MDILAIVRPYLKSQNNVENQRKEETRENKRILNLRGGGKQPGETAKDLRHNGEGGQLSGRFCSVVLCNLGKLGEQPEGEGGYLEESDRFLREGGQSND